MILRFSVPSQKKKQSYKNLTEKKSCSLYAVNGTANEPNLKKIVGFFFCFVSVNLKCLSRAYFREYFFLVSDFKVYVFIRSSLKSWRLEKFRKEKHINLWCNWKPNIKLSHSIKFLATVQLTAKEVERRLCK